MKVFKWIRRSLVILTLYGIGLLEGYYLPRYGLEWMLAAMGATAKWSAQIVTKMELKSTKSPRKQLRRFALIV